MRFVVLVALALAACSSAEPEEDGPVVINPPEEGWQIGPIYSGSWGRDRVGPEFWMRLDPNTPYGVLRTADVEVYAETPDIPIDIASGQGVGTYDTTTAHVEIEVPTHYGPFRIEGRLERRGLYINGQAAGRGPWSTMNGSVVLQRSGTY